VAVQCKPHLRLPRQNQSRRISLIYRIPDTPADRPRQGRQFRGLSTSRRLSLEGAFDKMQVLEIDPVRKELIFRLPFGDEPIYSCQFWRTVQTSQGSPLELRSLPNGQARLALRVPLKYVLRGVKNLDPKKLPNGDPLPGVPSGEMPALL
jgi:hypothetical protein